MYLLKIKSDVIRIVPDFITMIEKQLGKSVKCFHSDNAKELRSTDFFASKDILHHYSCVETPQQNAVVERKHQHLLNVGCAFFPI